MSNSFKIDIDSQLNKEDKYEAENKKFHWTPYIVLIISWTALFILSIAFVTSIVYNVPGVCLFQITVPIWFIVASLMIIPSFIALYEFTAPFTPDIGLVLLIFVLTSVGWAIRSSAKLFELLSQAMR